MKFFLPEAAINQHIAILGKTGSGKSYTCKGIVEHLLDQKRQVCVLDPTAAWYGLRLGADGKSRGYDVVLLGGKHADIPLSDRSGCAVARLVTEQLASVVIDTSGLTVGQYTRWFIDFAETLYTTIRHPLHLVIDESHYFMPQGGGGRMDGDTGKMLHCGNRLMSGGRSLGIRGMMITQRPAKLHKDSLTCADTLIAMRVIAPQDRSAIKDWIDGAADPVQGKAVLDSLAQLRRGEGWVWYPEGNFLQRIAFPKIKTYDSSATPVYGAKAPKISEINLAEVKAAMAEAVKEAEANDPKLLRKRITELEKKLSDASDDGAAPALLQRVRELEKHIAETSQARDILGKVRGLGIPLFSAIRQQLESIQQIEQASQALQDALQSTAVPATAAQLSKSKTPTLVAPPRQLPLSASDNGTMVSGGMRRMLIALAQRPKGLSASQLGVRAGLSSKSGTFGTYLGKLRSSGWIDGGKDRMTITQDGLNSLGVYEPLPSGRALLGYWLRELGDSGASRLLAALAEAYPDSLSKHEAAQRAGLVAGSGTTGTYLGKLRSLELIEGRRGDLRASEELFD